jgi:hypothetical protein
MNGPKSQNYTPWNRALVTPLTPWAIEDEQLVIFQTAILHPLPLLSIVEGRERITRYRLLTGMDMEPTATSDQVGPSLALSGILEKREVLQALREAINSKLAFCTEQEYLEVEALSNRAFNPHCTFDRKHRLMIYALALAPDQVDWSFKLRERVHRLIHRH